MPGKIIHGASITADPLLRSTYNAWNSMKQRCLCVTHHFYKDYGGRGITVCERWLSFENFLADMKVKPEGTWLERRDNSKGYSPNNCYWATPKEQGANKRNNRLITINGETAHVAEWERRAGLPVNTVYDRLRRDWPIERLLEPLNKKKAAVECCGKGPYG